MSESKVEELIEILAQQKRIDRRKFFSTLGLSGGVMTYVSFVELFPQGIEAAGEVWGVTVFFIGVGFMFLLDQVIPEKVENPHHIVSVIEEEQNSIDTQEPSEKLSSKITESSKKSLMKTGIVTALAIAIHNFPEGLATFGAAISDTSLGIVLAVAISIHNIPEGISVSVPIFYATGNRRKAFWYSFLSGLAEPVGAALGYLILFSFITDQIIGGMLGFIAGIMVYISLDEILPTAQKYDKKGHLTIIGIVVGMLVMAISLVLL